MITRAILILAMMFGLAVYAQAAPSSLPRPGASTILSLLGTGSTDALAGSIRGYLVRSMPDPLYEAWPGWGYTADVTRGIKWKGAHPELMRSPKNDGKWRHIRVSAVNPANTLIFDIRDLQYPEPGRVTFTVFLAFDARVEYEQQNWDKGIRLYSGSARARCRVRASLACEATFRFALGDVLLPETVLRFHVVQSNVNYDNFVTEHLAGMGGEAAEVLGSAIRSGLHRWHPSLERDLLGKANAAIEKSADTKEVRLSLAELLKKKGWLNVPKPPPAPANETELEK